MGHTENDPVAIATGQAREHMAQRIADASRLAAQHVGMPVVLWDSPSGIDWSGHLVGPFMQDVRYAAYQFMFAVFYLNAGTGYEFEDPTGFKTSDPLANAIRWLTEVAYEQGLLDGENPTHFGLPAPPLEPDWGVDPPEQVEALLPAGRWPSSTHLRLHYLADIGSGWKCRDCGVGLIDVCRDDDTVTDAAGRRMIRPGCGKRLPTRDHRIPRQLNGSNGPDNLDMVCRPCNSSKGAS